MSGGIVRGPRPESQFDQIERKTVREERLSYRARGVLFRLLSNIDGFSMTATELANQSVEGRGAILSALKELRAVGYLITKRTQDKQGRWSTSNVIYDQPQLSSSHVVKKPKFKNRIPVSRTPVDRIPDSSTPKAEEAVGIPGAAAAAAAPLDPPSPPPERKDKEYFSLPEFGNMVLEKGNGRDLIKATGIVESFSIDQINKVIVELEGEDKLGFPSNVSKKLKSKISTLPKPTPTKPTNPTSKSEGLARFAEMKKKGVVRPRFSM